MIFDSLVLYDRKRDQTKKERNTKVGSNRSQAEQTTQVAEQNKQKNRSDIVRKPVRWTAKNPRGHIFQHFHTEFDDILECSRYIRRMF